MESDGAGPQHPPLVSEMCASKPDDAPVSAFLVLGSQAGKFMWVLRVPPQALGHGNILPAPPVVSLHLFSSVLLYQDEKGRVLQSSLPLRRPSVLDAEQCAGSGLRRWLRRAVAVAQCSK